ncbi:MAG: vWA domain-containing protein [Planctomycetota bacterium]|jgi:Ca-activated chloride channel family protein
MSSIDSDDPRLTQYALGEMDAAEAAAFEAELDDAARAEVEAIRGLAGSLETGLAAEPTPTLSREPRRPARAYRRWAIAAGIGALAYLGWLATRPPTVVHDETMAREPAPILDYEEPPPVNLTAEDPVPDAVREQDLDEVTSGVTSDVSVVEAKDARPGRRDASDPKPPPSDAGTPGGDLGEVDTEEGGGGAPFTGPSSNPAIGLGGGAGGGGAPGRTRRLKEKRASRRDEGREGYDRLDDNPFRLAQRKHTSTFSIDVDTASYSNVRRFITSGRLPPRDAVRIEELVNYFKYDYAPPAARSPHPFNAHVSVVTCPWNTKHRLARIALKGKEIERAQRPPMNLVFLIDVSGSMRPQNKLPLLKQGMHLLVDQLTARDRVAIVTYAGQAGVALKSTRGSSPEIIHSTLNGLGAGGSTNGAGGIQVAYEIAQRYFLKEGVNRVVLATDGDFNVGVSDRGGLSRLIEEKAKSGVFLSVLGFGTGNYQDAKMEDLSNKGNGNYAYIDSLKEAKRALVEQLTGTLIAIAKDVKIQVFFNPRKVAGWRLVGYVNRKLAARDFNDDKKDAGEIGAGHSVTALYEIVPQGVKTDIPVADDNPFLKPAVTDNGSDAMFRLRLRYKQPDADKSQLMEVDIRDTGDGFDKADTDMRFAASVAAFGLALRKSPHRGSITWQGIHEIAKGAVDDREDRMEFMKLLEAAMRYCGVESPRPVKVKRKGPATAWASISVVKNNVVSLGRGSDDGVEVGQQFDIIRGPFVVGSIRITSVTRDKAVGEFTGNVSPETGDTVRRRK